MIPQRTPYLACQTPHGPMMLVSSSGWAHSPITLIFTALGAVYGLGADAFPPTAPTTATSAAATKIAPKRLTSPPRFPLPKELAVRFAFEHVRTESFTGSAQTQPGRDARRSARGCQP